MISTSKQVGLKKLLNLSHIGCKMYPPTISTNKKDKFGTIKNSI